MSLVRARFSSKLQVGFNCSLVPNVAKNMADLINICIFIPYFAGRLGHLKPPCIRCSHFKVDDVSALEPSSKVTVHIVEDNVTASLH
jgi:hypothetical protein